MTAAQQLASVRVPALETRALRKNFGPAEIIRGVDLTIARGERHAVIGPNGAGKSTLFNLISGLLLPLGRGAGRRAAGLQNQSPRVVALLPGHQHFPQA
jgi:ABC-type branched-subunit amino acid transport system ATPase component